MSIFSSDVGMSVVKHITDLFRSAKSDNYISYTKPMRVEPVTTIDSNCLFQDGLQELLQVLQNIFAGYYMQAVSIDMQIGSINVMRKLDKLNPNRDPVDSAANTLGWLVATEHHKGLPNPNVGKLNYGLEALLPTDEPANQVDMGPGRDSAKELRELDNLATGKALTVQITDGQCTGNIIVNVRLIPSSIPSKSLVHILSKESKDMTMRERHIGWKSGRLSTIRDMILVNDLVRNHRAKLMADSDDKFSQILARKRKNTLAAVLTANPSVATASGIVIMSKETADQLEAENNIKLKNFSDRQAMLDETSIMLLAVMDPRWNNVTIYHSTIAEETEIDIKALKISSKGNGPDIGEILKAYKMGSSPSL